MNLVRRLQHYVGGGVSMVATVLLAACVGASSPPMSGPGQSEATQVMGNPVQYFEIPVSDLDRAVRFYEAVFDLELEREVVDGYEMALFPYADGAPGASGALAKGDVYVPSKEGAIIYFSLPDIDEVLARGIGAGGLVLYAKKAIGEGSFVAELQDSEGNRIGLHQTGK